MYKYVNGEWKSRTNRELEEMGIGENIVKWIKGQRISWLGHLERMEEDRMSKKIFTQELKETKQRGRLRKGWREEVERDLHVLRVRRWRELVKGQNGGTLLDRPKPTAGCSANGERRRSIYVCMYVCMYVRNLLLTLPQTNYWILSYPRAHLARAPKRYTTTIIINC
jgi:hypothetical protein